MKRNHGQRSRFLGYYNVPLLHWRREQFGLTVRGTAIAIGMNPDTCARVFKGRASQKYVRQVADFFQIDWSLLHDLTLTTPVDFDRAVLNGKSKAVRSSGPKRVGALGPAPVKRGGTYTRLRT